MFTILIIFSAKYLYLISIAIFIGWGTVSIRRKEFMFLSIFTLPLSYILSRIASSLYYNPRPFVSEHITPLIHHIADNGFPSDHALLTGTLAAIVTVFDKRIGTLLWILAIMVGGARVLAGVHHTTDIIGSYIIAIAGLVIGYILMYHVIPSHYKRKRGQEPFITTHI